MSPEEQLSRVALVKSETQRLSAYWRGFSDARWEVDTFCPGWGAQHAVSHLATGADFYTNSIRRALESLPPEPPYGSNVKEFFAIRAAKGEELMALPREEMMGAFDASAADVNGALAEITAGDLGKLGFHPRGLTRLDAWIGLRLVELVAHDWDVRYGDDAEARVSEEGVEGVMTFLPASQSRLFGVRENLSFDGRFLFRSREPEREWTITVSGQEAKESADVSGSHDAVITADGEAHFLLLYGRAKRGAMQATGRLEVEGNAELANQLLCVLYTNY
ncbi:MAG: maleylpyruvate isomerase family mycothiol-dependent enzyme [Nitrospinae bacterium]|nr:maleylpyruvate isomerase family mycothiol-dependent enzyme [Nitrospinota bacterium]